MLSENIREILAKDFIRVLNFVDGSDDGNYEKFNNCYNYNGGVIAIVVDGVLYATPLINTYTDKKLESLGFTKSLDIGVPYNGLVTSPGFFGTLGNKFIVSKMRNLNSDLSPSDALITYYADLKSNPSWIAWNELVKRHYLEEEGYSEVPFYSNVPEHALNMEISKIENDREHYDRVYGTSSKK